MPFLSPSIRLASLFGFFTAFGLGCVVSFGNSTSAGDLKCGDPLAHNDANCVCDPGYERCNAIDDECCEKTSKPGTCDDPNSQIVDDQCFCNSGYTWCDPDDENNLSCCEDPNQGTGGTSGATDSGTGGTTMEVPTTSEGTTGEPPAECPNPGTPPASCNADVEFAFCTHPESCGPQGSTYYECEGGVWVDKHATLDQQCDIDGSDFGYGCIDTEQGVIIECGNGSGEACTGTGGTCMSDTVFAGCKWGKQSEVDCFVQCTEIGDTDGVLYDYGSCGEQDGAIACLCCDEGDEGCPVNGGGSTGDGGSTGG